MADEKNKTAVQKTPPQIKGADEYISGVMNKINQFQENGDLKLPANYSPENALRSAYLKLLNTVDTNQSPVLEVCKKDTIANALLEMVLKGLNPAKNQCYFIAYGNVLQLQVSYMGNLTIAKRVGDVKEVNGAIIYEGDVFEYEIDNINSRKRVVKHEQKFENIDNAKIRGAYATVLFEDGSTDLEIMPMPQIVLAWQQGKAKGNSMAHKNFPDQMALKTVKNRAVKVIIGTSDDESLFNENDLDETEEGIKHEIASKGNKIAIGFGELPDPVEKPAVPQLPAEQQKETITPAKTEQQAEPVKAKENPAAGIQPSMTFDAKPEFE